MAHVSFKRRQGEDGRTYYTIVRHLFPAKDEVFIASDDGPMLAQIYAQPDLPVFDLDDPDKAAAFMQCQIALWSGDNPTPDLDP
jgi:hypothetical protein